ncbi:MAG: rhodanese-like domain-containing protein [Deltaproteobacteria bacterium]|nr:rhodanese-like domain-containing protein [Deltaproteobacteria bacterium]
MTDDIKISRTRAHELVTGGAKLIDVRTEAEFAMGAVPGAVNIPVQFIAQGIDQHAQTGDTLVLYCKSGMRSDLAAKVLRGMGFAKAYNLGGIGQW